MKIEAIETIKKRYERRREWLLIQVTKMDESTTTPLRGRLLAHSPHRYEVYEKLQHVNRVIRTYVTCASDELPKGYAAAF
ncbi:MAG: hypothetical protein A3G87_04950 [Omnitrophica bacterium RIFCSPLOWO2_12_FULL_50_11]|nr:MAG: hypothetical protein A3G87_04950 [Omnitrophica bacterium RIFCSPLOWO2_12_FULL_50_11]